MMQHPTQPEDEWVLSVHQLNYSAREVLEQRFPQVWVKGEISNLIYAKSGHCYFTLKDHAAQIRCAYFKKASQADAIELDSGIEVIVCAKLSLYGARGDYQLIVKLIHPIGQGVLEKQFTALKKKLAEQGLFNPHHKKNIPQWPESIAVITSPVGAAIADIQSVVMRRNPLAHLYLYPSLVQGEQAPQQLIEQLQKADHNPKVELILMSRGGGSIEDLWAFNNAQLVQAIFDCKTPVISAIGHEIDFTLADFVADCRAPTPSAGAELISPDQTQLRKNIANLQQKLINALLIKLDGLNQRIDLLSHKLRSPHMLMHEKKQKIQRFQQDLFENIHKLIESQNNRLQLQNISLRRNKTPHLTDLFSQSIMHCQKRLAQIIQHKISVVNQSLERCQDKLQDLSPGATLDRGYAIVKDEKNNIITQIKQWPKNGSITLLLQDGQVEFSITNVQTVTKKQPID